MDLEQVKEIRGRMSTYSIVTTMRAVPITRGDYFLMQGKKSYCSLYLIRDLGYVKKLKDLEEAAITDRHGVAVRVQDVAKVSFGPGDRRSLLSICWRNSSLLLAL